MAPEEVAEAFETLRKQGKVLEFGVSNFLPSQFNMLQSYLSFPLVTNQVEISSVCLSAFQNGTIDQFLEKRISPMAWSHLGRGILENEQSIKHVLEKIKAEVAADSIYQIALAWLLHHPGNIIPIIGSGNISRIKDLTKSSEIKLSTEQWFEIWQSAIGKPVD